jgi:hypothetical protein
MSSAGGHRITGPPVEAVATRLDLHHDPSVRTILDGVWRPHSWDTVFELTGLVAALDASQNRVTLIMLNPAGWHGHPRRIEVVGRTVRVAWFVDLDASVLIATTNSYQRVDLLVRVAEGPIGAAPASRVDWADVAAPGTQPQADDDAAWGSEAAWESEGGRVKRIRPDPM